MEKDNPFLKDREIYEMETASANCRYLRGILESYPRQVAGLSGAASQFSARSFRVAGASVLLALDYKRLRRTLAGGEERLLI